MFLPMGCRIGFVWSQVIFWGQIMICWLFFTKKDGDIVCIHNRLSYAHTHTDTHIDACTHTHRHTHTDTRTHTRHTHIDACTHIHRHTHRHTHTYKTYTHPYMYSTWWKLTVSCNYCNQKHNT